MKQTQDLTCSRMVLDSVEPGGFRRCHRLAKHQHPTDIKSPLCAQHFDATIKALRHLAGEGERA